MFVNLLTFYPTVANGYRVAKDYERAKEAYEKASKGQEMLSSYPFFFVFYCRLRPVSEQTNSSIMLIHSLH